MELSANQLKAIAECAVAGALASQKELFDKELQAINEPMATELKLYGHNKVSARL